MSNRGKSTKDTFTSEVDLQFFMHALSSRSQVAATLKSRGDVRMTVGTVTAIPSDANNWQIKGHIAQEKGSIPFSGEFSTATGTAWIQTEEQA